MGHVRYAFRRFVGPVTDAPRVPATANRLTLVTHHGFCELVLSGDREECRRGCGSLSEFR